MSWLDYCSVLPRAIHTQIWPVEMSGYVGAAVFGSLRQPEITLLYAVAMAASRSSAKQHTMQHRSTLESVTSEQ